MPSPIHTLTIKTLREGLLQKRFSVFEIVQAFLTQIEASDSTIHAFQTVLRDSALAEAHRADLTLAEGGELSSLFGVPVALKDIILAEGAPCTASSRMLENYIASYDATVVARLKAAGAIIIGKTNLDEFAMGSSTENSAFGPTRNPRDPERVPGGSSGGSAAAVAGDMALVALGSDTGGSIRQPAGFCGVVGMKPTYGRVSRFGLIAMASSLDQIGPIAKTVEDAECVYNAIAGEDFRDATSRAPDGERSELPLETLRGMTIGIPDEYFHPVAKGLADEVKSGGGIDRETEEAIEGARRDLERCGMRTKRVSLPHTQYALSTYYVVMPAEVSTNLARFDGIRYNRELAPRGATLRDIYLETKGRGYGRETKRRIILGTFVLSSGYYDAYYAKAQKVRRLIKRDFDEVFREVDLLLTPVSPTVPFKLGEKVSDPLAMYLSDVFTIPANLSGIPAISIPVRGREEKLPVGFQLMAKPWREADLFAVGKLYERL
ncbi:MAG: Asp-tRNA(Asn)/Glu-tRNA(Gln) amidotransferase subunit GatA [Candidatus Colwellbacteria bacterium]|nr:Asp-tRNA(Asn)/Glu-tRNA(Gln) amidotransferase subunit GatA [Candidatus Colwellbacteria bacterium]